MPSEASKVKLEVIDNQGKTCDTSFYVGTSVTAPDDAAITAVTDAIQNLITGGEVANSLELLDPEEEASTCPAPYYWSGLDKIRCVCRSTTDGSTTIIDLPAPTVLMANNHGVFLQNGEVDPIQPDVAALITFINAHCLDTDGNQLTFVRGFRHRSQHIKQKFG